MELPDPTAPPTRYDQLAKGVDCARHPLIGCIIANNNTPPEQQARNFLYSMHKSGQMTDDEFRHWAGKLVAWEKAGGVVNMPPEATAADHPPIRRR